MASSSPFSVPVEWFHLDPEMTIEIGVETGVDQSELDEQLRAVPGLQTVQYSRKGADFQQLVLFAGTSAGIIQGIDVLWRWFSVWRVSRTERRVEITLRSQRGGVVQLKAHDEADARVLVEQLARKYR